MIDRQDNSAKFSDDAIRSFLLGELTADDQTLFAQRLFTDDGFESRVRLAEFALTDDYARDWLTRAQKTQFRKNYLVSAERKRILGVSETLRARFTSEGLIHANLTQKVRSAFDISQPVWRYAFATLILLIVFATVWRGIKEPRIVQQIIPKPVTPKPTATLAPQQANHPNTTSSPNHVEEYPALPPHDTAALFVSIDSKNTAENPVVLMLPPSGVGTVRLELSLVKTESGSYRAELLTMKGELVFSADSLAPTNDRKIDFDVPARALKPADYQIKLSRISSGSPEIAATCYFRVQ